MDAFGDERLGRQGASEPRRYRTRWSVIAFVLLAGVASALVMAWQLGDL